ncbi:MAG: DUF4296 domain-containing protein [Chitinophagaceae bacterium]
MRLLYFIIFLIIFSCSSKQKVPQDVIPIPKMAQVLYKVMEADALVLREVPVDTSLVRYDSSIKLYLQILQPFKVSFDDFKKSIHFYQTRPDLLKILFDSLQHIGEAPVMPQ